MKSMNIWYKVILSVCVSFVMVSCATKKSVYAETYLIAKPKVEMPGLGEFAVNKSLDRQIDMTQFKAVELDLAYAGTGNQAQRLNIIYPSVGDAPYKVIMVFHGGGWAFGSKESEMISPILYSTTQGYAIVSVNYRLSGEAVWPAPLYDAKAAVRFIRANAEKYKLDASKIVVWGNSTGGHIVEMLGATNGKPEYEDLTMGNDTISSEVQGVVSWYGVSDMTNFPNVKEPANKEMGFDTQLAENKEKADKASPLRLVTRNYPPILLVHGTNDQIVPYVQSVQMRSEVTRYCGPGRATLKSFETLGHGDAAIKTWENVMDNLNFVDKILWPDGTNPYRNNNQIEIKVLK
ncbi:alpha/beta hydrolase [uncultured Bacteroides sp.]|uniref:alpha/beta hydrolase n=1 Tax=uncultured Bacteroides sp. TaxID=162156 RepID=UPI002AA67296|nr:alpha/beta hydrolase [uncultured Bacteroides sp.]